MMPVRLAAGRAVERQPDDDVAPSPASSAALIRNDPVTAVGYIQATEQISTSEGGKGTHA
jgi:hypothetical protein